MTSVHVALVCVWSADTASLVEGRGRKKIFFLKFYLKSKSKWTLEMTVDYGFDMWIEMCALTSEKLNYDI